MSIIYSYPEQGQLNADDMFIGTSAVTVGGKQKNITRNFTVQQIADFINQGTGFVDPLASDFQIPVFNQQGKKITGSIMSQNIYPNGSAITIAGSLTVNTDLTASGNITLGSGANNIILQSTTTLGGPIKDSSNTLGVSNQILISNSLGNLVWQNYEAGLTYEGTWNASTNTPTLTSGQGVSGHFYIVSVAGNTNLDGNNDWHVGDWAVFFDAGGGGAGAWQKIDNTSVLTGNGTANTFAMWTATETLNDSILTQDAGATKIQVAGGIDTTGIIQPSTTNANLQIQGNGTGGVEVRGAGGNDGKIQLNCSANSHGVTLQSPPHSAGATYTLVLPTSVGTSGQTLTTDGSNPAQLSWSSHVGGTVTSVGYSTNIAAFTAGGSPVTSSGILTLNKNGGSAGQYIDGGTGNWVDLPSGDTYTLNAGAKSGSSVPLNLDAATGSDSVVNLTEGTGITLTRTSASEITITGSAQGVTSVATGNANTITIGGTATAPTVAANTAAVALGSNNLATGDQIQTAINTAVSGSLNFKGTFNANTGTITSGVNSGSQLYTGTTGGVAITIGDYYIADTAGNFFGSTALQVGDEAIALATVGAGGSTISSFSVVPSAAAGVTSVLPSSTGLVSSGQPLVITPAGGTGNVTIESTAYAGGTNVGHVPAGGLGGQYLDGGTGSWATLPAGYTSWTASSDQNTNITVTDTTNLPFTGRLASAGPYGASSNDAGIYTDTAINTGEVTIGLINNGGTPSATTFYRGDGQWAQAGGLPTKTVDTFTGSGQSFIDLTVEASSKNYIDMYIDGVYQAKATYGITTVGVISRITLTSGTFPTGVSIETVTTT